MIGDMKCPPPGAIQQTSIVPVAELEGSVMFETLNKHLGTSRLIVAPLMNMAANVMAIEEGNMFIRENPMLIIKNVTAKR